ncbi:hypothetical protein ACFPN0_14700 [Kitasatospora cinereorecta]
MVKAFTRNWPRTDRRRAWCTAAHDAELVTLAVIQALLALTPEARWIRHARARVRHLFPCTRPGSPATTSGCAGTPA